MEDSLKLSDRVIVITGGANGIGHLYCEELASEGANIVIADIDKTAGIKLAEELNLKKKNSAIFLETNVTSEEDTQKMVEAALKHFGKIDILINNAGSYPHENFDSITFGSWKKVISINLDSVFLCSKAVLDHMKTRKSGKIINVATNLIWIGLAGMVHYVTAKSGLIGFTRSLAREVGEYNITVNSITPGAVVKPIEYNLDSLKRLESIVEHQSIKWCQRAADLVGPMKFLCSSDSDFMSGQLLNIDGGLTNH